MSDPSANKAYSRDGYIIDQARLTHVPYGCRTSDYNGCGWIAVYNFLRCIGRPRPEEEISCALARRSLFRGLLGTSPFRVLRYLRRLGYPVQTAFGKKRVRDAAAHARAGIVLYRHTRGWHFVAFEAADGGRLRFFNALPGCEQHILSMPAFLDTCSVTPFLFALVLPA